MEDVYTFIGDKIRELRTSYGGKGISQEELAAKMETTANTISRWEKAVYKPSPKDLHRLAQFFKVSIATFFPERENPLLRALTSATGDLRQNELHDLILYAQYRAARRQLKEAKLRRKAKK